MITCNQCNRDIKGKFWYNISSRLKYVFCSIVCYDRFWDAGCSTAETVEEIEENEQKLEGGWDGGQ